MSHQLEPGSHLLIFCPLPPKPNGIADYFAEQLPYLAEHFQCTVVLEDNHPQPERVPLYVLVISLREYLSRRAQFAGVKHLYHVGNNPDSSYLMPVLLTTPGVVVIHDLNLHHLIEFQALKCGNHTAYRNAVFQQYGRLGLIAGEETCDEELKKSLMAIDLQFNGSVIESAHSVIVHSRFSSLRVDAYQPGKTTVIPHHLAPRTDRYLDNTAEECRQDLGLPLDRIVISSMGYIARAKQIGAMLAALASLKRRGLSFFYVLAGEPKLSEYDVVSEIEQYGLSDDVIITGYLSEEQFFKYFVASDLIANLRHPSGGETSGTFIRAMGMGKCCLTIDIGPFVEVPDECVVKIPWDSMFGANLEQALMSLAADRQQREEIGGRARKWITETHDIRDTSEAYVDIIERCPAPGRKLMSEPWPYREPLRYLPGARVESWKKVNGSRLSTTPHTGARWWEEGQVPLAAEGATLLLISEDLSPLEVLTRLYGYSEAQVTHINIEEFLAISHAQPFARARSVLAIFPMDIFVFDPVEMFIRLNWLSEIGSHVVVNMLLDSYKGAEVELSRAAVCEYMMAAGIRVDKSIDAASDISFCYEAEPNFRQEWCFRGKVASRMSDRYPRPYYNGQYSVAKLVKEDNLPSLVNLPETSVSRP